MLKKLTWKQIEGRHYVDHTEKKVILWKTSKKDKVELILNISDFRTLLNMVLF